MHTSFNISRSWVSSSLVALFLLVLLFTVRGAVPSYNKNLFVSSLNSPTGVWQNSVGTLFIAETGGNNVRAVSSGGGSTNVAGTGTAGNTGDGGQVRPPSIPFLILILIFLFCRQFPQL
jgi:hypothetical protein